MSKETVLPQDGSAGLDPHQEVHSRLSGSHDDGESRQSGSTPRTKKTPSPRVPPTKGHVTQEEEGEDPVRTQPQPSPSEPGQRHASRSHNGLRYNAVSTSTQSPGDQSARPGADAATAPAERAAVPHACTCGADLDPNGENGGRSPGAGPTSEQPRRQPSMPVSQKMSRKLRSSLSVNSDSSSSQKPPLPEDCCVHCILACLFCEFLALCNMVATQASCGVCTPEACCCCCGDDVGDDCNCPCDMDCGIMDACCESSDCLEICMECCGICFPT